MQTPQNHAVLKNPTKATFHIHVLAHYRHLKHHRLHNVRYIHDSQSIGESRALLPASNHDDWVSGFNEALGLSKVNTEVNSCIDILQPVGQSFI